MSNDFSCPKSIFETPPLTPTIRFRIYQKIQAFFIGEFERLAITGFGCLCAFLQTMSVSGLGVTL
jgi:hypothetical protein